MFTSSLGMCNGRAASVAMSGTHRQPFTQRPVTQLGSAAVAAPVELDMEVSGLKHLSEEARTKALDRKANKFEKVKVEKGGHNMWTEVHELAQHLREGKTNWEDLNLDDIDIRLKWTGMFHRSKRTPKRFMMRIKVPNGEMTASQLRYMSDCIKPYGEDGCADITTRAAIQLRGLKLEDADNIIKGLNERGMTSFMSGMDNVRNLTGNPLAGVDPHELIDTRPLCQDMQDMITDYGKGNPELTNLPRKINICFSSTRDDFPHAFINDVGFEAVKDPSLNDEVVFNLIVGGYFSIKRNIVSVPTNISVTQKQMLPFTKALLEVFRDHGPRDDRQKTRIIWMIEALGQDKFFEMIEQRMGDKLRPAVREHHTEAWERRDILGVHPQKQDGLFWVGASVPSGRLLAQDFEDIASVAEKYGDGTIRLTCDENVIFTNVAQPQLDAMLAEPLFQRFKVNPGNLERGLVSCTGSQFCGFGLAETKNRAIDVVNQLESELEIPKMVRIHFTGCPNSCGQAQVGDIGLMGAPAKLNGKATEGFKILLGGKIGENPELAKDFAPGVPVEQLAEKLREILVDKFGATPKQLVAA